MTRDAGRSTPEEHVRGQHGPRGVDLLEQRGGAIHQPDQRLIPTRGHLPSRDRARTVLQTQLIRRDTEQSAHQPGNAGFTPFTPRSHVATMSALTPTCSRRSIHARCVSRSASCC